MIQVDRHDLFKEYDEQDISVCMTKIKPNLYWLPFDSSKQLWNTPYDGCGLNFAKIDDQRLCLCLENNGSNEKDIDIKVHSIGHDVITLG